jgi:hypothetical protein
MKTVTTKELISLAGIAIATPMFAMAILVSARSVAGAESDVSLLLMALCGAVISGITGFGRRTTGAESRKCPANRRSVISHS